MPIVFLFFGVVFLVAAVRNTQGDLFALLKDDFSGPDNFFKFMLGIFAVGALGYVKPLRPLANAFMVLLVLVLFLNNRGFFNQFVSALGYSAGPQLRDSVGIKGLDVGGIKINANIPNPFG
jgi:hypothetical protein